MADLVAAHGRIDRDRTDLGEVLPHHVQRAAPDDGTVADAHGHPEFLDRLIDRDGRLGQQPALDRVRVDQGSDRGDVGGDRTPNHHIHVKQGMPRRYPVVRRPPVPVTRSRDHAGLPASRRQCRTSLLAMVLAETYAVCPHTVSCPADPVARVFRWRPSVRHR
jgi:hypothetical protein